MDLTREALRPGVVYADPYGHTLMIARWCPQNSGESGRMLAVDAQPDGTIGIKRFWRGSFFYRNGDQFGESGFKAFRPLVEVNGRLRPLNNAQIQEDSRFLSPAPTLATQTPAQFYDRMDRIINPQPLDPVQAYYEIHKAVYERLQARGLSVANGEAFKQLNGSRVIPMPEGEEIFRTTGPWEEYATPVRDLKLLIALDVLLDFPDRIKRHPESFSLPDGLSAWQPQEQLLRKHLEWAEEFFIVYTDSGGKEQRLTIRETLGRMEELEMAYNPNDCIEIRWGEKEKNLSLSAAGVRRAPREQRLRMENMRRWFRNRTFPVFR
ncbi:MAG: hypothetical protein MUP70_06705 [Candidatus Aminicenantes bacterium]|nr:hypothetical protein [Candidatus Aminicenantes bacterium]